MDIMTGAIGVSSIKSYDTGTGRQSASHLHLYSYTFSAKFSLFTFLLLIRFSDILQSIGNAVSE